MVNVINVLCFAVLWVVAVVLLVMILDCMETWLRKRKLQKHNLRQYYLNRTEQNFRILTEKQRDKIQGEIVDNMLKEMDRRDYYTLNGKKQLSVKGYFKLRNKTFNKGGDNV